MNPGPEVNAKLFENKHILVTGGTGSLGKVLVRRILSGEFGKPGRVTIFSRDEAKQYDLRLTFKHLSAATEEVIYHDYEDILQFKIGDVRDSGAVASALRGVDVVFNTAALKQVPSCEYFPHEAVQTNIAGVENIIRAIESLDLEVETVVGISTDKACKPINVMGMTKAIQERMFISANLRRPSTRFICARYGNVLASRGSVVPLFHNQIKNGGPVTLTTADMTRFLLSLDSAVDTIIDAYRLAQPGETFIPRVPSSSIVNIARALVGDRDIEILETGIRPGEKIHEILVSEEEAYRTVAREQYFVIRSIIPEIRAQSDEAAIANDGPYTVDGEYSSRNDIMSLEQTGEVLEQNGLLVELNPDFTELFGA